MSKLNLNPNIFFLLKDGKIIVWDYLNHNQYEIDHDTFDRLLSVSKGEIKGLELSDLRQSGLATPDPLHFEWQWDELSKIYHIGCRDVGDNKEVPPIEFAQNYLKHSANLPNQSHVKQIDGEVIPLPKPSFHHLPQINLWELMKKRMTSRSFNGEQVKLQDFVNIIYTGFGRTHDKWDELIEKGFKEVVVKKAHPSGGGLHPLECFLVVDNVESLEKGLYYYNWYDNKLIKLPNDKFTKPLQYYFYDQFYVQKISFGIFICNDNKKSWSKYPHSRGYRDVNLDVGHASQSMLLMATLHDVLTWESAYFRDSKVSDVFNIDGITLFPSMFLGFGYGARQAIPDEFIQAKTKCS